MTSWLYHVRIVPELNASLIPYGVHNRDWYFVHRVLMTGRTASGAHALELIGAVGVIVPSSF